ncbi:MAG: hypothetical protein KJ018_19145 [Burkholderiales bacterium]|nr:hypothetical protein [Burkholderiales bacterium]
MNLTTEQLLKPAEAAALLRVKPGALEADRRRPQPQWPYIRINDRVALYSRQMLERALETRTVGGVSA